MMVHDGTDTATPSDDTLELTAGRRAPYTQLGDWVALAAISNQARALYWLLALHLNHARGDNTVWPSRATLAAMAGIARVANIDRYLRELADLGAIEIIHRRHAGGMRARNHYLIHQTPPPGYTGPTTLSDYYNRRRDQEGVSPGRDVVPSTAPRSAVSGTTPPPAQTDISPGRDVVPSTAPPRCCRRHHGGAVDGTGTRRSNELEEPPPPTPPTAIMNASDPGPAGAGPDAAAGAAAGAPAGAGTPDGWKQHKDQKDGTDEDDLTRQAETLLANLPTPWRVPTHTIPDLTPHATAALKNGWAPTTLTNHLTANPSGIRNHTAVLATRLRHLPPPPKPQPRNTTPTPPAIENVLDPEHLTRLRQRANGTWTPTTPTATLAALRATLAAKHPPTHTRTTPQP